MKCKYPWKQYWHGEYTYNNKKLLRPYRIDDSDEEIEIPCGRCINCRINYGQEWAVRCVCEAKEHEENYYLTLTYDPDHVIDRAGNVGVDNLEYVPTANNDMFSKFMKALRQSQHRKYGIKGIRFLACSEYGDKSFRSHHHAIIFGLHLEDLKPYGKSNGYWLYTSKYLDDLWKNGEIWIGEVTAHSAQYVAKYAVKNTDNYKKLCDELNVDYPCLRMSRRPGIGKHYFEQHKYEIMQNGGIYLNGKKVPVPDYWLDLDPKYKSASERICGFIDSLNWNEENIINSDLRGFLDDMQHEKEVIKLAAIDQARNNGIPDQDDLIALGIRRLQDDIHVRDKI